MQIIVETTNLHIVNTIEDLIILSGISQKSVKKTYDFSWMNELTEQEYMDAFFFNSRSNTACHEVVKESL
jgi:hypothetical protein